MADGLVDLQVNGYGGVDFSNPQLSLGDVFRAAQMLYQRGTAAFLPTVITSSWTAYQSVLPILAESVKAKCDGSISQERPSGSNPSANGDLVEENDRVAHPLGIHLEGPFISPEDGARGVHPKAHIRLPSIDEFDTLYAMAKGAIRFLTLAPEQPGALELIGYAASLGVHVSIGHTLANASQIEAAVEAGARFSTHLGNGLPLHIHRHQNPIWPQLANPLLTALIIADGHHLPANLVRVVLAVKGPERVIVTSDSSPAAGLPPGDYELFGVHSRLDPSGKLWEPATGFLAGSSATLQDCLNWLERMGIQEDICMQICRENSLTALGAQPLTTRRST